jgi:hypothetical protein
MGNDKDKKDAKLSEGETRELVERVAWEVVPPLAEALIREELKKQLGES